MSTSGGVELIVAYLVLGACWGSFINAVGGRLLQRFFTGNVHTYPEHGFSLSHRSKCFKCGQKLRPINLIPVFSFIGQFGRSSCCGSVLPFSYLLSEVSFALMFVYFGRYDLMLLEDVSLLALFSILYLLSISDVRHMEVPFVLVGMIWLFSLSHYFLFREGNSLIYIISTSFSFLILFVPGVLTARCLGRASLGIADPLVFSALVPYIEFWLLPYFMLASSLIGIFWWAIQKGGDRIPFLPSIHIAFVIIYFLSDIELLPISWTEFGVN